MQSTFRINRWSALWWPSKMAIILWAGGATAPLHAGDWPQWGGMDQGRNMVSPETGLPASFQPGEKSTQGSGFVPGTTENVRWAVRLGSYIYGNPTVADGRVFVGTDDSILRGDLRLRPSRGGMVQCLDEATGRILWRLATPNRGEDRLPAPGTLRTAAVRHLLFTRRRGQGARFDANR